MLAAAHEPSLLGRCSNLFKCCVRAKHAAGAHGAARGSLLANLLAMEGRDRRCQLSCQRCARLSIASSAGHTEAGNRQLRQLTKGSIVPTKIAAGWHT